MTNGVCLPLRQYFAAQAPEHIPYWFMVNPWDHSTQKQQWEDHEKSRYFQWRWYYADAMLAARGEDHNGAWQPNYESSELQDLYAAWVAGRKALPVNKWLPISSAPQDTRVLVAFKRYQVSIAQYSTHGISYFGWINDQYEPINEPFAWMPLPAMPGEEE